MEPKFQTSFIPKKTVDSDSRNKSVVYTETNIFSLAATIVFITTTLFFGGLFLYKNMLVKQVAQADSDLESARSAIQPEKIQEIIQNNLRITNSKEILDRHLATSRLLTFLSGSVLKKVKFEELSYQNKDGVPSIIITSEAQNYNTFAYQEQVLSSNEYIKNPSYTEISLTPNGNIRFKFSGRIEPSLVSYKKGVESSVTINQ